MSRASYANTLPIEIVERIRNIEDIYKIEHIKLVPVNKSYPLISSESPRTEIYFPNDATLNFKNAILEAEIKFNHRGNTSNQCVDNYVQSVYPPRYGLASLIQEFSVFINGDTSISIKQYNYIHNWIKDWLNTFDVEINNGINDCKDPSILYSKIKGDGSSMSGRIVPRRGYPASVWNDDAPNNDINARLLNKYHMNLSDSIGFFGEGSCGILNTAVIGEIKLEIVWTSQIACCILGSDVPATTPVFTQVANTIDNELLSAGLIPPTTAGDANTAATAANTSFTRLQNIEKYTAGFTTGDTGIPTAGNSNAAFATFANNGAIPADATLTYSISNIVLHIQTLQFKTSDYYDTINRLVDSGAFRYHFKRYVLNSDVATTSRAIDYRVTCNSECLNYVLCSFRPGNYNTLGNAVNTLISPLSVGHTGSAQATFKNQVLMGLPYTFNQSRFFIRNGQKISKLTWKIDETEFIGRNNQEMYIDNLKHWRNYLPGQLTKPHEGLKNVHDFENCYYTGILSFEVKSDDDVKYVYPLRGLNTNGKSIAISVHTEVEDINYTPQTGTNSSGFSNIDLQPDSPAIPVILICTTARMDLLEKNNIKVSY